MLLIVMCYLSHNYVNFVPSTTYLTTSTSTGCWAGVVICGSFLIVLTDGVIKLPVNSLLKAEFE